MSRLLAPLALLAPGLAGCLALAPADAPAALVDLTEPVLGFGELLRLSVAASDGTRLHVDVQLPDGEGPFPVILEYTPYALAGRNAWAAGRERGAAEGAPGPFGNPLASYYVPRGYAVGAAHVRGTGESGGCLTVGGPEEGTDGYAIVEHVAAEPWSSGRVALVGTSYVGTTPIETAILRPPHLSAIVSRSAVTEWYKYYFENGEPRVNGDPPPSSSITDPVFYGALALPPGPRTGATGGASDATCLAEYTREFWLQDDYDAFWQARNHGAHAANVSVPVLLAHGFQDENVATNMVPAFLAALEVPKWAWLQQHEHGVPSEKAAYHLFEHRFLDRFLLDRPNGAERLPPVVVEDNLGEYRTEAAWPPRDAAPLVLHLGPEGTLGLEPPPEGTAAFRDDGRGELVPALEGVTWLRFATEPLPVPLHVAGAPLVRLDVASDATDTQLAVLLFEESAEGALTFLTRGYLDLRHRDTLETGKDLAPGTRYAVEWALHPRDHRVAAGHRLVVVVKSSDPYVVPDATRALNTLHFGPDASRLAIPVLVGATRAFAPEAPEPWR